MIMEVGTQISSLQSYIVDPDKKLSASFDRSGYIHNLKIRIHNNSYQQMLESENIANDMVLLRAMDNIANSLERVAELCLDCTHHVADISHTRHSLSEKYTQLLDQVALGINLIERASEDSDSQQALKISELQQKITTLCQQLTAKYSKELKSRNKTNDLIAALFIIKSIKLMGDALLKISDALLSRSLGQTISTERYFSLTRSVAHLQKKGARKNLVLDSIAETRSGSAISGISDADEQSTLAIFKDGAKHKLKEEYHSVKRWHEVCPGIAPRILSYQKHGQSAALLIEHLAGKTFEKILLQGSDALLQKALQQLTETLSGIWKKTLKQTPVNADYMQQLEKRLSDVYIIHSRFEQQNSLIADITIPTFSELLKQAKKREHALAAPFSVYIHGDFNTDNIIYDSEHDKINFIDLHRSCYMDYVQDVSVFMVSNYRLQTLDQPFRQRVLQTNMTMYHFAATFARQHNDTAFELRLALGLARSLATSTRFTLDETLAKAMFYRSRFLIEQILNMNNKQCAHFRTPVKEIFVA